MHKCKSTGGRSVLPIYDQDGDGYWTAGQIYFDEHDDMPIAVVLEYRKKRGKSVHVRERVYLDVPATSANP
jgi:hypothetical protein